MGQRCSSCKSSAHAGPPLEASVEVGPPRSKEDSEFLLAKYPKCLEDVQTEWMSTLLRSKVLKMEVKVKLEAGVTGDAAIFALEYEEGSSGPASIVLKYAKSLESSRALAQGANMYEKETFFYQHLHGLVAPVLPIPAVVDVFIDPEKPKEFFCIAMEDLSVGFETLDQVKGINWQEAKAMAEDVGRFHGAFWKHGQLKNQVVCGGNSDVCNVWFEAWTRGVADNPGFIDTLVAGVQDNKNLPKNGGRIDLFPSDELKQMVRLFKQHGNALIDAFHEVLDRRPFTLTHGDLRADNVFRKIGSSTPSFKFIDWQTFAAAAPGCDMTQLLAGSIAPVEDMDHLPEILEAYLAALHEQNEKAKEYTIAMLKEDFTIATTLLYLGFSGPFAPMLDDLPDGHPIWNMMDTFFPRYMKCVELLDCAGYVIDTAKRLGLSVDPATPWFVQPAAPKRDAKSLFKKSVNMVLACNRMGSLLGAAQLAQSVSASKA